MRLRKRVQSQVRNRRCKIHPMSAVNAIGRGSGEPGYLFLYSSSWSGPFRWQDDRQSWWLLRH